MTLRRIRPRSELWGHRDYLRLWGAQGVSAFGTQITVVALPLAAILTLDASPFEVGVLTALEFLPFLLVGIPAGVWVDRLRKRPILVLTDVGRALFLASVPIAYAFGVLTLPQLYAVAFLNGVLTVFFTLAYQAYLPVLLARRLLVDANARFEAAETLARLAGPGAGGGLVGLLTAPVAVLADAVSFLASGSLIFSMHHRGEARRAAPHGERTFGRELREGAALALRDRYVRSLLVSTAIVNVGFGIAAAVLLVFAVRTLGMGAGLVGLALSVAELGGLAATFLVARLTRALGVGRLILGSTALFPLALVIIGLAPSSVPLPVFAGGWALASFSSVLYNATTVSVRQARVPTELQGRVVGFNRSIVWGMGPLGALVGGALGSLVGLRFAILVGALVSLAAVVPAARSPVRELRELPHAPGLAEAEAVPESPTLTAAGR